MTRVQEALSTLREQSALLADWAEGTVDSVRADEARAEIIQAVETLERTLETHGVGLPIPSRERMDAYHSRLPAKWFDNQLFNSHGGHVAYRQGAEACYVCVLLGALEAAERERDEARRVRFQSDTFTVVPEDRAIRAEAEVARLRDALRVIAKQQPRVLGYIRANGFVFTDMGREPGNWQHLAFSIYTDLCEVDTIARSALEEDEA